MSRFKRELMKEMKRNAKGQYLDVQATCPKCGRSIPIPVDAALFGKQFNCPGCGLPVEPSGDAPMADSVADSIEKGVKKINRK